MTPDETLATLRLGDSFLPTGGDSVSYGLEQLVAEDRIEDATDLRTLLESRLRRQVGPCDAVALGAAHESADGDLDCVLEADRRFTAVTLAPEFRESAEKSGRRLLELAVSNGAEPHIERYLERVRAGDAPGNHPVAFGVVAAAEGVPEGAAKGAFVHAFVTGQLAAAQRILRIGHTEAQEILAGLRPTMIEAIEISDGRAIEELASFTPMLDVASARHERAERRLFVS